MVPSSESFDGEQEESAVDVSDDLPLPPPSAHHTVGTTTTIDELRRKFFTFYNRPRPLTEASRSCCGILSNEENVFFVFFLCYILFKKMIFVFYSRSRRQTSSVEKTYSHTV